MSFDQIRTNQQVQCIVYRCLADPVILIFHLYVQRFCIKMIVPVVDLFEDGVAFRGFPQFILLQMGSENLFDLIVNFFILFFRYYFDIFYSIILTLEIPSISFSDLIMSCSWFVLCISKLILAS